jgi:hypothetical protein
MWWRFARLVCPLGEGARRHAVTTPRRACRAPRATVSQSRRRVAVRAPTELGSAAAFQAMSRGLKGGDGVEEPVGGRQRDLVDELLRSGDGTPIEGSDPTRKRVDEAVQLRIG